jgi:AcrR family transcriptional regulator
MTAEEALAVVRAAAEQRKRASDEFVAALVQARAVEGVSLGQIAEAAGVTRQRVHQLTAPAKV